MADQPSNEDKLPRPVQPQPPSKILRAQGRDEPDDAPKDMHEKFSRDWHATQVGFGDKPDYSEISRPKKQEHLDVFGTSASSDPPRGYSETPMGAGISAVGPTKPETATGNERSRTPTPDPQGWMRYGPGHPREPTHDEPKDDVRDDVKRAYEEAMDQPKTEKSSFSGPDFIMLALGGLTAQPLCHSGWDAVVTGEHTYRGIAAIIIGLITALSVGSFHWWKNKLNPTIRDALISQSIRWLPIAFVLFFVYAVGPQIYKRAGITPSNQDGPASIIENANIPLRQIIGKHFKNEVVPVDGYWFINCTFENVTFEYNGGSAKMDNPNPKGTFALKTTNGTVNGSVCLLKMLGQLGTDLASQWEGCPAPQP